MPGFKFNEFHTHWPEQLLQGSYLWIWHADKIPPHIGISRAECYFSLTYKTCEIQEPVAEMKQKAERAGIPLVLVDLSACALPIEYTSFFSRFERAETGKATCLTPIREIFGLSDDVKQLSDLLTEIENQQNLKDVFALHLNPSYEGIPDYSVDEIMRRIDQLHETKRTKNPTSFR